MKKIWNDAPEPWQISFQDSSSKTMEGIEQLHDDIFMYLTILLVLVGWILVASLIRFKNNKLSAKFMSHGTILELIWTISPAGVLLAIAFPSFRLLYLMDFN